MFGLFRNNKKIGGIIGLLGLEELYNELNEDEQIALQCYEECRNSEGASYNNKSKLIYGNMTTSMSHLQFIEVNVAWACSEKKYDLANKLIRYGQQYCGKDDLLNEHFYLQGAAECFYKQRNTLTNALELVEQYCRRDIELFPKYREPIIQKFHEMPRILTFQRLAILYEKNEEFEKAIAICEMALEYGLEDGTKGGYEGRLLRLKSKNKKL